MLDVKKILKKKKKKTIKPILEIIDIWTMREKTEKHKNCP